METPTNWRKEKHEETCGEAKRILKERRKKKKKKYKIYEDPKKSRREPGFPEY